MSDTVTKTVQATDIAIVGMAAHLPGAASIEEYWQNLRAGIRSIKQLSEEDLLANGESQARLNHRNYVPAAAMLEGFAEFDAEFFGLSPKEAAIMDPQHRQFLEVSWEALENAGHMPEHFGGPIGVFAGCGMGSYFYFNLCSNRDLVENTGMFLLRHTGNDKDFLATRLSHILDLKGPSLGVQTACSTSLVAVHYAAQSILNGECDMAIAGGVTIELPHGRGYVFQDGEILSPDGECHAFDHRAQGTVFGSGAGAIVLRRLSDAIADGDHIWAVIKGSAVNNDGSDKAGYLAPSVGGQAAAVADALSIADVSADTVDYVECHGTGTYLGDPIEVAALTEAYRETTEETGFCRIGSVKTNIGHLDTAAGAASLIKTALSLHHKEMPPSLGFEAPNPAIEFETSPFAVNAALRSWERRKGPRRAGVNSLGVGGTNAHVVIEEAPDRPDSAESDWPLQLIAVSGRGTKALEANTANLAAHLRAHPEQPLADVAYTLLTGRRAFENRQIVLAESHEDAAALLESNDPRRVFTRRAEASPEVVFMFPGGGAQYVGMGRDLFETEPVFADWMERGFAHLADKGGEELRALWLATGEDVAKAEERLKRPSLQLPLIMMVEYALAQLWISWGVTPAALIGHSMGENTAACLAGVMSFEDCLGLVHLRGQLFDRVPAGGMLSVPLPLAELEAYLGEDLDIASVNAPTLTVVSGSDVALDVLATKLAMKKIDTQRVQINIAAHSRMLTPILEEFGDYLRGIDLAAPTLPIISNRTGKALLDHEATDPEYWVGHLRHTVLFADGISELAQKSGRIYLEVGPGKALSSLSKMHADVKADQVLSSLRHPEEQTADDLYFLTVLAELWTFGVEVDFEHLWGELPRQKVVLPTYAFQRSRYFIEPGQGRADAADELLMRLQDTADWTYAPVWTPRLAECEIDVETELERAERRSWLIFVDQGGTGSALAERLRAAGQDVVTVATGDAFAEIGPDAYALAPERGREGYDALMQSLMAKGRAPDRIVHLWLLTEDESHRPGSSFFHRNQEQGLMSLFFIAQAVSEENLPTPLHITAVSNGAVQARAEALPYPEKATVLGAVQVMGRELPGVSASLLDVEAPSKKTRGTLIPRLLEEVLAPPKMQIAAWRGEKRFERSYRKVALEGEDMPVWQQGGTYLITGGFGGIGITLAERMIREAGANVVLLGRESLPARESWAHYLQNHAPHDRVAQRMRAVERLESLGGSVLPLAADVCNSDEMATAAAAAREAFGEINGVIHAAGVIDDGPLLAKTSASIEDVLAPKLHGTQVLEQLFPDGSLDWLMLFASSSTATAPAGQLDYVAANAYLNAYAQARAGGKTRVRAINWGLWSEVGMAADAVAARQGSPTEAPVEAIDTPLLTGAGFDAQGNRIFTADLTAQDWILDEHRTGDGAAVMPGTGYIALAYEALAAQGETENFAIEDLLFLRPLHVAEDADCALRVTLRRSPAGYAFAVQTAVQFDGQEGWQTHAEAQLVPVRETPAARLNISELTASCPITNDGFGAALRAPQEAHMRFGPRWKVLRETALGEKQGLAKLRLDAQFDGDGLQMHPGLLDIATGWAMDLIPGYAQGHLWVPVGYAQLAQFAPLPDAVVSHVRLVSGDSTSGSARFDVSLADPAGNICVKVSGLALRQVETAAGFTKAQPLSKSEVQFAAPGAALAPLSAAEERLAHNLSQGIPPEIGAQMFEAALRDRRAQLVVSSLDLAALIKQAEAGVQEDAGPTQSFERPELETDFIAPRTDIERTLAGFWQELLGVEQVGVQDSFFDLGGHSLIAVRLFAMVKKAWSIDFPISVLFEAPTIETCAALIAERVGDQGPQSSAQNADAPEDTKPTTRFTHLVPMHQGEGGAKTPFFLVAGMFGNVLNLRHLAHLIGADRPFYGLQARGLFGDAQPHDDLVDAATDYIKEMKQVQPEGPYLLGGFSGGGITAYEIARQLEAMGDDVRLVAMLDTPLPVRRALSRADRMRIQLKELRTKGVAYPVIWAKNRIAWEIAKRQPAQETEAQGQQFHDAEIEAAFLQAVARYQVQSWNGNLALFRPPLRGKWALGNGRLVDQDRAYVFHDNDWGQWVPDVQVFEVPGDHDSMVLEPNVRVLATRLKAVIAAAEAEVAPHMLREAAE